MPISPTFPGVYIEEIPSSVRTIVGVATSITAFVGRALRGPVNEPIRIQSFAAFERTFGGLWVDSALGYSVSHFFLNGGADAIVIRVVHREEPPNPAADAAVATFLPADLGNLELEAASEGLWGNSLRVRIDWDTRDPADTTLFNLTVKDMGTNDVESYKNLSVTATNARFVSLVLEQESRMIRVVEGSPIPAARPPEHDAISPGQDPFAQTVGNFYAETLNNGDDGDAIVDADIVGSQAERRGIFALETADLFNILVLPPPQRDVDIDPATWPIALSYCRQRRAMLIVDPPFAWNDVGDPQPAATGIESLVARDPNAATYFPHIRVADPLKENRLETFAPSGLAAGIWSRIDVERGVWKAPAGQEATMIGVRELTLKMTDGENGQLNPIAVNCLRSFPVTGNVVWGARTLAGADRLASQWKYIPVRRLALFIEESLYRGTQWVVFEPNDEPLWAQIRLNVGAFMQDLFRKGAFQGTTPREAYLVKCDRETTTQNDINLGIVNIIVGFAPLKPAEFVIIKIQQLAGNVQA